MLLFDTATIRAFWHRAAPLLGLDPARPPGASTFAEPRSPDRIPALDRLSAMALHGHKQGTAHLDLQFVRQPLPRRRPGDHWIVTTCAGTPVCVIRFTAVDVIPYRDVPAAFAAIEGEGDLSLAHWRTAHLAYFQHQCAIYGAPWSEDQPVVCEQFTTVWAPSLPAPPLMTGAPVPSHRQVTLDNWRTAPFNRWAFHHVSEIVPSAGVSRGTGPVWQLPRAPGDIHRIPVADHDGTATSVGDMLDASMTDGLCVLHRGAIVAEHYGGGMRSDDRHILKSISKSVTGLLAGILVAEGRLDPDAPVPEVVPEAAGSSAFATATIRQLLDMTAALDFAEDYAGNPPILRQYREASGWAPPSAGGATGGLRGWLAGVHGAGAHGRRFTYASPNSDMLGWVLERAAGMRFADLLSDRLWQPMGAEADAAVTVDRFGAPRAAGGICCTLRDLARLGQMVLQMGQADGRQVVPVAWVADIRRGGDRAAWTASTSAKLVPTGSYRSQWWLMGDDHGAFHGRGIHGQMLWIDPAADVVVAKLSAQPVAVTDATRIQAFNLCRAICAALAGGP